MHHHHAAAVLVVIIIMAMITQEWLNAKIHRVGSLYNSGDELMRAATGSELNPAIFLKYLTDKYTELYKL